MRTDKSIVMRLNYDTDPLETLNSILLVSAPAMVLSRVSQRARTAVLIQRSVEIGKPIIFASVYVVDNADMIPTPSQRDSISGTIV